MRQILEGKDLYIDCSVKKTDDVAVFWVKNDTNTSFIQNGTTLTFVNITRNMSGNYICYSQNLTSDANATEVEVVKVDVLCEYIPINTYVRAECKSQFLIIDKLKNSEKLSTSFSFKSKYLTILTGFFFYLKDCITGACPVNIKCIFVSVLRTCAHTSIICAKPLESFRTLFSEHVYIPVLYVQNIFRACGLCFENMCTYQYYMYKTSSELLGHVLKICVHTGFICTKPLHSFWAMF